MTTRGRGLLLFLPFLACFVFVYYDLLLCRQILTHDSINFFGPFQYMVESLAQGSFPLWDPYMMSGTYFYPAISHQGLLDPAVPALAFVSKLIGTGPVSLYVYLRLLRLGFIVFEAYLLFAFVSQCRTSAAISSGVLLLAIPHSYFAQSGGLDIYYLTPLALYFLLRYFDDPAGPGRYFYLACITLVVGVSMNIYIPVPFLLTLVLAIAACLVLGIADVKMLTRSFSSWRFRAFLAGAVLATAMMAAPPLAVMQKDASAEGELFPLQRVAEKNGRILKRIVATESGAGSLSGEFTKDQAIFGSWGNLAGLLFPDIPRYFSYWLENDLVSYMHMYMGIIPFVFAIFGFMYHKSRYKWLFAVLMLFGLINGFSALGVHDRPFNGIQRLLNGAFPPLRMFVGRESFGQMMMLCLGVFMSMGVSLFLNDAEAARKRCLQILGICVFAVLAKIAVAGYFGERLVASSAYDMFIVAQLAVFAAGLALLINQKVTRRAFSTVMMLVCLADLGAYNEFYKPDILQDASPFQEAASAAVKEDRGRASFQYFREPLVFMPPSHPVAFGEEISRTKAALSYGFNHGLFSTRRYYDLLTNTPLENQFVVSGMVYPVVSFFPLERVVVADDRRKLLQYYSTASPADIPGHLFIEEPGSAGETVRSMKPFDQYADATWLTPQNILAAYDSFWSANREAIRAIRGNLPQHLNNEAFSIEVRSFSVNDITLGVRNMEAGYLQYNDGWSKYWRAFDGAREVPVKIANYNSKAVFLPSGDHTVRFVFDPVHYKIALALYAIGLSAFGVVTFMLYFRLRRIRTIPGAA